MSDYVQIARVYLYRPAVAFWVFLLFCLVAQTGGETLVARQTVPPPSVAMGGIMSYKSYLAMFVYFNACVLGVMLRDCLARPWATVVPGYRQKHLVVATLLAGVCLGVPLFVLEVVGLGDNCPGSGLVIALTCLAAGLWTMHHPALGVLAIPFLVFVMARADESPGLAAFLEGNRLGISGTVACGSLVALGALAWRLLTWTEEGVEYATARVWGDLLRGRKAVFRGPLPISVESLGAGPADPRGAGQTLSRLMTPFSNLTRIDRLDGYCERSLWQRVGLWRMGTAPTRSSASLGRLMVFSLVLIPISAWFWPTFGAELAAKNIVLIFAVGVMTNPFAVGLFWFMRRQRLGYESLRPLSRPAFVREIGLAIFCDTALAWLGGVVVLGVAAILWAPELLQARNLLLFLSCTAAGQLGAFALLAIWSWRRGTAASIWCAVGAFMVLAQWMIWAMDTRSGVAVHVALASVVTVASLVTIALAYRRWCLADLDA
ncbi:MAG: hypothetical protein JSS02_26640 [Planctomycetes bacterium]|nr:hypothetical protein [Planctomycetota bacterium]